MTTLFVHRLTVIDASLLDPGTGLLGESWLVDVELDGSLDHQGMVLDFALVKRQVKETIDRHFDHKLLVPSGHPCCRVLRKGRETEIELKLNTGARIHHLAPDSATTLVAAAEINPVTLSDTIVQKIRPTLPANVEQLRLKLYPEAIDGAWYRYSHGLKHHEGNCQRIAHGHRSRIRIFRDDEPAPSLEGDWAGRWRDVYLGSREDLMERFEAEGEAYCRFGYTAAQGRFELSLPASRCYLIDCDSTVENLASHIAETLKKENRGSRFRVMAFEGVDKGAIGEA